MNQLWKITSHSVGDSWVYSKNHVISTMVSMNLSLHRSKASTHSTGKLQPYCATASGDNVPSEPITASGMSRVACFVSMGMYFVCQRRRRKGGTRSISFWSCALQDRPKKQLFLCLWSPVQPWINNHVKTGVLMHGDDCSVHWQLQSAGTLVTFTQRLFSVQRLIHDV